MIKKFDKSSIAILTVIAIFAIFALCLIVANIATAHEEETTPQSEEDQIIIAEPTNEAIVTPTPSNIPSPGIYDITLTISGYDDYNLLEDIDITEDGPGGASVYHKDTHETMSGASYNFEAENVTFNRIESHNVKVSLYSDTAGSFKDIYCQIKMDGYTPEFDLLTTALYGTGKHKIKCRIGDYYDHYMIKDIKIRNSRSETIFETTDQIDMLSNPYLLILNNVQFDELGQYTLSVDIFNNVDESILLSGNFNVQGYSPPTISYSINSTTLGQASVGVENNFHVDLSNLTPDPTLKAYIKVRDPEGEVRYLRDASPISLTSTTASQDFTLMPHKSGSWSIEAAIVNLEGNGETELNRTSTNFTATGNPAPPSPGPQPTPGGGGSEGTITQTSDTPQTGENALLALATINLIAIAGLAAWVLTRKRIVIIRPKH